MIQKFVNIVGPSYLNMSDSALNVDQNIKPPKRAKEPFLNRNNRVDRKLDIYHNKTLSH